MAKKGAATPFSLHLMKVCVRVRACVCMYVYLSACVSAGCWRLKARRVGVLCISCRSFVFHVSLVVESVSIRHKRVSRGFG